VGLIQPGRIQYAGRPRRRRTREGRGTGDA
jgi:hypothetical protein